MTQLNGIAKDDRPAFKKKAGVKRMIKHNLRIDMTPMVDLGFLLISSSTR